MRIWKQAGDGPKVSRPDFLETEVKRHPFRFKENPENPLNERIVEAVNRMGGVGSDAESQYRRALDALRHDSEEVISIVAAEYRDLPEDQYLDRWSLVQLLAELQHPASLRTLDAILMSEIPPERSRDPHSFTTVGEEVVIRTTAVDAITRIAADGNEEALQLLLKHVQHASFSVKRACVQGYLAQAGEDARGVLLKVLPERDHYILDIRRMDVREVPQAQGGLFVISPDRDELPPAELPADSPDR